MRLSMDEVGKQHDGIKKLYEQGLRGATASVEQVLDLFDTIEALQQENNGWQERYYELDAGHSRLFKDFCKLQKENEQLQAQVARVREALEEIKDNLHAINCVREMPDKVEMYANEAISIIDEIGGKEDV